MKSSGINVLKWICAVDDLYGTEGCENAMLKLKVETQKGEKDAN